MAEESGQDKTEEPTAQRLSKAREEGQIARSQELAPAAMMVMATLFFTMMGQYLFNSMGICSKANYSLIEKSLTKPNYSQLFLAVPSLMVLSLCCH
jgi:flagellar biosynthesis protein FlhB